MKRLDFKLLNAFLLLGLLLPTFGLAQTTVNCGMPLNETYCYGNNDNTTFSYISSDGTSALSMTFNAGGIENCCDDLIIYDGANASAPVLFDGSNGGNLAGLSVTSTGPNLFMAIDADGSFSCQDGQCCATSWDWDVECYTIPTVNCGTPLNETYCYGNNDNTTFSYIPSDGTSALNITFNAGGIESCCDDIIIYDGANASAPVLFNGSNGGNLAGLSVTSTGPNIFMAIDADGSVSCQSGSGCCTTSWDWDVVCMAPCAPPTDLMTTSITDMSVDLTWTPGANCAVGAEYWVIPAVDPTPTAGTGTNIACSPSFPINVSGLSGTTTYEVWVLEDCGTAPTSLGTFTTLQAPLSNPSACQMGLLIADVSCPAGGVFSINVSSAPGTSLGTDVELTDVKIIIQHAWDQDLDIYLTSPNGVEVELSTDNGGSDDHYGDPNDGSCTAVTNFNMTGANGPITSGSAPFIGSYVPEGDFADFNDGSSPVGIWQLRACDDESGLSGELEYVELVFGGSDPCAADMEVPTVACPADINQSNDAGQCGANVPFSPTIGDNCPGVTASASPMSGSFFSVGTTSVTVTAMDVAGNTATCSFNVTVNDTENPTITCPADLTVSTTPGFCTYNLNPWGTLPTSDNCSSAAYVEGTAVFSGDAPAPYNLGVNTVTFTVWDEAGNTGTCSFDITVEDNTICGCANPQPGDSCDDMDANTNNDMIQGDCNCAGTPAAMPCSELFFSEYMEGTSDNKCIEIYNPTGAPVTLDGVYSYEAYHNGASATATFTIMLSGTIAAGDVYVMCNPNQMAGITPDLSTGSIAHSGDDALVLKKNGVIIDAFGQVGNDPGTGWTAGGVTTVNATLRRKSSINAGDPIANDVFDPSQEWDQYPFDTADGFGEHDADGCEESYSPGDIIITEIMNNPDIVDDAFGEYFEVYNTTGASIDLNGWVISDNGTDMHTISSSVVVAAGGFAVLGRDNTAINYGFGGTFYSYGSDIGLANGDDEIILTTPGGMEIDRVEYDGGPNFPDLIGASMNLDPDAFDHIANDNGSNWCASTTEIDPFAPTLAGGSSGGMRGVQPLDRGTPNKANEQCVIPCDIMITSVDVTDETCAGDEDGIITINATCTTCAGILYSIDGGTTTQMSNTFTGLMPGTYSPYVEDSGDATCNDNNSGADVTVAAGAALPSSPVAGTTSKEFCQNDELAASLANTGVNVTNSLTADEKVVWVLQSAPAGSAYMPGDEFTTDDCGGGFKNFGELAVANTSKVIRVQTPGTAPVGTYTFSAYITNCVTGCSSSEVASWSITVYAAPTVEISADPDGDLCLGQMDVEYSASITSTDGGTYSYLWCAYNSGDGSGTCFNGFDNNTAAMPTRDWTSSAGAKSVGVTVTSDVAGCEAEDLYSFEVVAPTMVACPMDMMGTLVTDDVTFDCAATFNWNHPAVSPGPCDPVILTITISGGSVSEGPTTVTPGDPYSYTFEELGVFTVTYDLEDAVGNTSSCSFTITVDGLPCGWVDNGGIGCEDDMNSSSYDPATETFSLTANNCALTGWPYSSDQLAFVFTELCGDGEIIARVTGVSGTGFGGVMMRDSEDPAAPMVAMGTNLTNRVLKQVRTLPGYPAFPQLVLAYDQIWVRVVRQGNQFSGFASTDGVSWVPYINQQVFMSNNCLRVGLFTYSEKPGNPITATFDNVQVTNYGGMLAGLPNGTTTTGTVFTPEVSLYPNPAASQVTLEMGNLTGQAMEIHIFNNVGQLVKQVSIDKVQFSEQLNVADLNTGVYNVVIKAGEALISKRLVIARP